MRFSREEFVRHVASWQGVSPAEILARPRGEEHVCEVFTAAIREFVERQIARYRLPRGLVEDLTQESLFRAWRGFGRLPSLEVDGLATWLYLVAHNVVLDAARREGHLRRKASTRPHTRSLEAVATDGQGRLEVERSVAVHEIDPAVLVEAHERDAILGHAIDALPERQRDVLTRWVVYEETLDAIASRHRIAASSAARDISSACLVLRRALERPVM